MLGIAKQEPFASHVRMTGCFVFSSQVVTFPVIHMENGKVHADSAVSVLKKFMYFLASARFSLYCSVGAAIGVLLGTSIGVLVGLGLIAVMLETSITIVVVRFGGVVLSVAVDAGGKEFVLVSVNLGTEVVASVGDIWTGAGLALGSFVVSTAFEVPLLELGSADLGNSRDAAGAGSISM